MEKDYTITLKFNFILQVHDIVTDTCLPNINHLFKNKFILFIYLFIFVCVGSSLLCTGFL